MGGTTRMTRKSGLSTTRQWLHTGLGGASRQKQKHTLPTNPETQSRDGEDPLKQFNSTDADRSKTNFQSQREEMFQYRQGSIKQTSCRPNHNRKRFHTGRRSSEPQARHMYQTHTDHTERLVSYLLLLSHHRASSWTEEGPETFPSLPLVLVH